jgi:tetraacyldisaccharide 4'-kinase
LTPLSRSGYNLIPGIQAPAGSGTRDLHEHFHALIGGQRKGPWAAIQRLGLWMLSVPYGVGVRLRNQAFDRGWRKVEAAPVPVISVGNLTTGGTGKTPCVEHIARFYRELGLRVAILSRGYGARTGMNDEALLLEQNLPDVPHLQGADRVSLARTAVEELESEVLLLDDGFQHRRIRRDLDIVLIDATNPWGHGYLLPRGLLREPVRGLKRAGLVLLTRCDLATPDAIAAIRQRAKPFAPHVPVVESVHEPAAWQSASAQEMSIEALRGRRVAAFCGLGNPEGFRQTLERVGVAVVAWRVFPDHHAYSREDVDDLRRWAREQPAEVILVTTQKDLVKIGLDRLGERELWALRIRLRIRADQSVFEETLRRVLPGM